MSGIAGFYEIADQCDFSLIACMTDIMAHRGPDGSQNWQNDVIALGHCSLITTPEAQHEILPLHSAACGLTVTCDARLDNRETLLEQLRDELQHLQVLAGCSPQVLAAPTQHKTIGDGALILAAYLRWGESCAAQLLGDFAFAIWDENRQQLFCARDHIGVKPFYYHHTPGERFVFGSEIKAIFQDAQVSRAHDEKRIAEYLLFAFSDHENTFYAEVARLPAAHTLTIARDKFKLERYWDLRDVPMQHDLPDAECDARLREIFFEAVRCRMRGRAGEVGGFLSGGIDSSAVMSVAREVQSEQTPADEVVALLPVFSTIYDEVRECDEREWMQYVLDMGGLQPNWIHGEERSALMDVERIQWYMDEPLLAPNLCSGWGQYQRASEQGVRVLLDGHGGDEAIGYGQNRLHELASAGQWNLLRRELRLLEANEFWGGEEVSARAMMSLYIAAYWPPARWSRRIVGGVERRLKRITQRDQASGNIVESKSVQDEASLIDAEFAERIGAAQILAAWKPEQPRPNSSDLEKNQRLLASALQPMALETLDKAAAATGTEARYPFWDKRLVEFCLSLPSHQKLRDGWSRLVIRRALEGVLPPEVQWRTSKNNFMGELRRGLRVYETERLQTLAEDEDSALKSYVDKDHLNAFIEKTLGEAADSECHAYHVLRAVCFEVWLLQDADNARNGSDKTKRISMVESN